MRELFEVKKEISLTINGQPYRLHVPANQRLNELLREDLGFTGTKTGCGGGECGVCTVLLNGKAILSCLFLTVEAEGGEILTIEGLAKGGKLHPLQEAFIAEGAAQCGFCTPGMIMAAKGLLDENPHPTEDEIKGALAGNLCRCTGYASILRAVKSVAKGRL
jgi:aerobic carbon-monoxide dehydrogenase small subunit